MAGVVKRSVSFPADVFALLEAEAAERGVTVSSLVAGATEEMLRRRRGLAAVAAYEAEYGALTEDELREADRILDEAFGL